jgi:hypothetical protein
VGLVSAIVAGTAVGFGALRGGQSEQPARPDTLVAALVPAPAEGSLTVKQRFEVLVAKAEPCSVAGHCAFLDNDRILIVPGTAPGIEVWDAKAGKLLKKLNINGRRLWGFRLSVDRKWVGLVTSPDPAKPVLPPRPDEDLIVLDTTTWKTRGNIGGILLGLAVDGRTVLLKRDARIEVWDVIDKKMLRAAPFEFKRIDNAALSPDGSLAVVSSMNEVAYWRWRDGDGKKYDRVEVGRKVDALVFSPDGKLVAEWPETRTTVEVRDTVTLKVVQSLSDPAEPRVPQKVSGMTFANSGKILVFGTGAYLTEELAVPHRIHFWDMKSGKQALHIDLKGGFPFSLDVSPDGESLAVLAAGGDVSLRVFDLK